LWLGRARSAGAGIVRINVVWSSVAGSKPPFVPTNPADPGYSFGQLDSAIESARAQGLDVMLTVLRAPPWAEGKHRPKYVEPGAWKPRAAALGKFAQALAKRYSGHFLGLPRVRYFEVWNEPNLPQFLFPQWVGKKAKAPVLYRKMLNSFYAGVHAAQPGATVIGGAVSPFGDARKHPLDPRFPRMRPLVFLRKVLCLRGNLKPSRCKSKPHLDALSQHPLNVVAGPHHTAINKNDVLIADFHRVRRVLRAAERAGTVRPRGHHPLWATEIAFVSDPPNFRKGIPVKKHARWLEEGLYLLWKQGAKVVINLTIRDPVYPGGPFTSGVFFHDGTAKPAQRSFRFPFVTHRKSKKKVGAWGKAPQAGKLAIQVKHHGRWRTKKTLKVGGGKIFTTTLRLRGKAKLRGQIGGTRTVVWKQR